MNIFRRTKQPALPPMTTSQAKAITEYMALTGTTSAQIEAKFPGVAFPPKSALDATLVLSWLQDIDSEQHRTPLA